MSRAVPNFPLLSVPAEWDDLTLLAAMVFLEAEGEPEDGQLGVGWVARNRSDRWRQLLTSVILAPMQFSCFNQEYFSTMGQARLTTAEERAESCWKAAASALWRLSPDPTFGADHYLNVEATKTARKKHDLPAWFDPAKVTVAIGRHTFLRLDDAR